MSAPAIEVEQLTKVFKAGLGKAAFMAVQDLNLRVEHGEVYGLIGPNSCGKSTTMKAVLNLVQPSAGRCRIFGRPSTEVASREQVGFLPENPYFYKHLSGLETLLFFGRLCGMSGTALRSRAAELLELTGLQDAAHRRVAGFSKGMLQRLGLAQALLHRPRLLILDEPTAGVDPLGSRNIRDLIVGFKKEGITVLVTSHLLEQMQEVCDRIGIMAHGRMVCEGRLEDLIALKQETQLLLAEASPQLLDEIRALIARHAPARLLSCGHPSTSLEQLFLSVATDRPSTPQGGNS